MITDRGSGGRGAHACEIQNMTHGYVWQREKPNTLDAIASEKMKRSGGNMVTTEDQRISTNSNVRRYVIMQQKEHNGSKLVAAEYQPRRV